MENIISNCNRQIMKMYLSEHHLLTLRVLVTKLKSSVTIIKDVHVSLTLPARVEGRAVLAAPLQWWTSRPSTPSSAVSTQTDGRKFGKAHISNWQQHQPERLKSLRDFRCPMKKFTLTLKTLRLRIQQCISDTVVKYFSIPLDFAYDGFASVTAGRLSKLCFCVFLKHAFN